LLDSVDALDGPRVQVRKLKFAEVEELRVIKEEKVCAAESVFNAEQLITLEHGNRKLFSHTANGGAFQLITTLSFGLKNPSKQSERATRGVGKWVKMV
jgi:hypothetical protein